MKTLKLLGKRVELDQCPVLMEYSPEENFLDKWQVMLGNWEYSDGWLIGTEPGNQGGILFSRESYDEDIIFSFTAKTVLPATRDVNALFCAHWDKDIDYLGNAYIIGLNGWYDHKSGIERSPETGLRCLNDAYRYTPGSEVRITTGIIKDHLFLYADDTLVTELIDPHYISGGHVGFSPYCTKLAIKDIKVQKAVYTPIRQSYDPEF